MAVDPVSKKPWIWDDVVRMRTLNSRQSQKIGRTIYVRYSLILLNDSLQGIPIKVKLYLIHLEAFKQFLIVL